MGSFTKSHNLKKTTNRKLEEFTWIWSGTVSTWQTFFLGYDVSLHLWRDVKYDGILEANGVPFKI